MLNSKRFTGTRVRHLVHLTALCLCLSGSLTNLVQAQSATDLALLKSTAPDRAAKLAAAAKLEGGITLYTSIAEKDLKPLIDPFKKNTV